ncbi:hypothetical protein Tco_1062134 [Tanacetum coccineum]
MMSVITHLTKSVTTFKNKINHGEGTSQRRENLGGENGQAMSHYGRLIKVEFPKFNGEDVQGWLYKVNKFFEMDRVNDDSQKIRLVSMLC